MPHREETQGSAVEGYCSQLLGAASPQLEAPAEGKV